MSSQSPPSAPSRPVPAAVGGGAGRAADLTTESTAGAWIGLLLLFYGAGSLFLAALGAVPAVLVPRIEELVRVRLELDRSEGGRSEVVADLATDVFEALSELVSVASLDSAVTAALAAGLLVAGLGVCWRKEFARRLAVGLLALKGLTLIGAAWLLYTAWVPAGVRLNEMMNELVDLAAGQGATRVRNPFAFLGSEGALQVWSGVYLAGVALPWLLALWLVLGRSVRAWCRPAPAESTGASPRRPSSD